MNQPPPMPPLPPRIAKLPRNARGYPVPFFVAWIDGVPDFRMVEPGTLRKATRERLCWICGEPLGSQSSFVIGPMCCVNHTNSEPPSHRECAEFAVRACPFMLRPAMERREDALTEANKKNVAGVMIERNPGVMAIYTVRSWTTFDDGTGRTLFDLGTKPSHVSWWREGRPATYAEVEESIRTGVPLLIEACGGVDDRAALDASVRRALLLARQTVRVKAE